MSNNKSAMSICETLANTKEMARLDALTMQYKNISSLQLMWDAATAFYNAISCHISDKTLILCGGGNNGGDGYSLACILSENNIDVSVYSVTDRFSSDDTLYYRNLALKKNNVIEIDENELYANICDFDLIIDAVYGTGFHGSLPIHIADIFRFVNNSLAYKISIDIPSGAICDTGELAESAFRADKTVTFEFLKPALVAFPARENCGDINIVSIGFPSTIRKKINTNAVQITNSVMSAINNLRKKNSNKGDFGKILSVCGSKRMIGAAYLSAIATLRSGIGLLYLACSDDILVPLQIKLTEPVFLPYNKTIEEIGDLNRFDAILHGCGCGSTQAEITEHIINNYKGMVILDADALNNIAGNNQLISNRECSLILTPHPGEMARLVGCSVSEIQSNRIRYATEYANTNNCYVVLKGAGTIIAAPDNRYAINTSGNSGLAKGGSGDVLAGMIAAYYVNSDNIFESICAAVYEHGAAADRLLNRYNELNMLPSDLLNEINRFL